MTRKAIFTIVSNNYLHFARTLLQSVRVNEPNADLFCVIVDRDMAPAENLQNEFASISLENIDLPDRERFIFQYSILELNTAVKPWAFEFLLRKEYGSVTYIDPDILLYRPLIEVSEFHEAGADIVVTPHLLAPICDDKSPSELDIRRAGTYNFGFCSLKNSQNSHAFVSWWQGKLLRECVVDHDRGIFVDQSWIDLVPGLFDRVAILRHPGYNVAYWNLAQRNVVKTAKGQWEVDGESLVFFHYSGFNPEKPERFSKHQNRFTLFTLGPARELAEAYASRVLENGAKKYARFPYAYGRFADGTPVPEIFRRLYREDDGLRGLMGDHPFERADAMVQTPTAAGTSVQPTYAMLATWKSRPDLQRAFSLNAASSIKDFYRWFAVEGETYFPPSVIGFHRGVVSKWDQAEAGSALVGRTSTEHVDHVGVYRAERLFRNMLGREPDASALRHYARLCRSRIGLVRALVSIGLSSESKQHPRLVSRILRASGDRTSVLRGPILHEAKSVSVQSGRVAIPAFTGIYPPDSDAKEGGFWVSESVAVPLCGEPGDRVVVTGAYFPEFIAKASSGASMQLQFMVGEELLHQCVLDAAGDFEIQFFLPAAQKGRAVALRVESDKSFIPSQIGLNGDDRQLAWRLKGLNIGDVKLFDCSRPKSYLSPAEYRRPPGVNIVGYIAAELGVGEGARSFARGAVGGGIPYSVIDVGYQSENMQRDKSALDAAVSDKFPIDIVYVNADQTPRTLDYLRRVGHKSSLRIGYWHWEQPELPLSYLNAFEELAEVWVPSAFVQDAVAKISPVPVFKVPHVIDFKTTTGVTRKDFGLPANGFAVLLMYDFHSYQYRKNPEASLAAFRLAAANRQDAFLVVKTINADKYPEKYAALKQSVADIKNVVFVDRFLTRQEVYDLESVCDCLISLHRAEGFGLGPAEMMYLGKPVIATGWSANMEFMTPMNSFPINYELKTLEQAVGVYEPGQLWAEADIEHAASALTRLLDQPTLVQEVGKRAEQSIRAQLSAQEIGRQYRSRLILLAQRYGL
ncbi:glycosyltransferase [Azoarcus sp. DN11]|uniref:glycosyltransferase n=1 Tax=Azoarcus sp. DN11 TaxID=356837 RepID=UPI000EB25072|nr:glycosyltransferase [Azoarcus sp. DN11]AYH45333.1 hypothetical protein CDA09_18440 [Azoarcus sp. DN11]